MDGLAGAMGRDLALTLLAFLTGEPVDHGVRVVAATVDEADKVEVTLRDTTGFERRVVIDRLVESTCRVPFHYHRNGRWCPSSGAQTSTSCDAGCV